MNIPMGSIVAIKSPVKKHGGFALITVLVIMLVAVILGMSAFQVASMEERMASNYRSSTVAKMASEYGAAMHFDAIRANKLAYENNVVNLSASTCASYSQGDETVVSLTAGEFLASGDMEYSAEYGVYECIQEYQVSSGDYEDFYTVKVFGRAMSGNDIISEHIVNNVYLYEYVYPEGFGTGMLGNTVRVTGQSTVEGGVHANNQLTISIDKQDDKSLAVLTSGFERSIPSAADFVDAFQAALQGVIDANPGFDHGGVIDVEGYGLKAFDGISTVYDTCELGSGSGALPEGSVVFCDGDLQVRSNYSHDLSGVVMISTNDIVFRGAGGELGESLTMAVIAKRDIDFNGSRDSLGLFWAGRDIEQNGNSSMNGSIIAGDTVTSNGGINFIATEDVDIPMLEVDIELHLAAWIE